MNGGAVLSDCGLYRYRLWRIFDPLPGKGTVVFIMLNPSTADAETDDPTIRRCIGFARDWGYSRLEVVNLFAFRATNPRDLRFSGRATLVGPLFENYQVIAKVTSSVDLVVAAWGALRWDKARTVAEEIEATVHGLHVLGLTQDGYPRHPLYIRKDTKPTRWKP